MERPSHLGEIWFWREAPRIGLTGVTQIEVGEQGVAYDANLASDVYAERRSENTASRRPRLSLLAASKLMLPILCWSGELLDPIRASPMVRLVLRA
jgi:hypothetical protein